MTIARSADILARGVKSPVRSPPGCLRLLGGVCVTIRMLPIIMSSSSSSESSDLYAQSQDKHARFRNIDQTFS